MSNEPKTETPSPSSIKETWIPYVIVCFVLIFALGIICVRVARDDLKAGVGAVADQKNKVADLEKQIEAACVAYKAKNGTLPPSSENYRLVQILKQDNPQGTSFMGNSPYSLNANGEIVDPWGTPFRITFGPDSKVHASSAGPDKIFGTPDDVTNQP